MKVRQTQRRGPDYVPVSRPSEKTCCWGGGGGREGGGRRQMEDEPNTQNYWLAWHNIRMCSSPSNATT